PRTLTDLIHVVLGYVDAGTQFAQIGHFQQLGALGQVRADATSWAWRQNHTGYWTRDLQFRGFQTELIRLRGQAIAIFQRGSVVLILKAGGSRAAGGPNILSAGLGQLRLKWNI